MGREHWSQRLSTAVDPFLASSGPPLHPHPDAREGEWGWGEWATAVECGRGTAR